MRSARAMVLAKKRIAMAKQKKDVTEESVVAAVEQPTMASGIEAEAPVLEPRKKKSKTKASVKTDPSITLEDLATRYLEHLETDGRSQGTIFSYRLELVVAMEVLGAKTLLSDLTPARILDFNTSDRVMKTRTGVLKARPSFLKTQRVLRLALVWAAETGLIGRPPLPENAATH
jgi:hypothetical protein